MWCMQGWITRALPQKHGPRSSGHSSEAIDISVVNTKLGKRLFEVLEAWTLQRKISPFVKARGASEMARHISRGEWYNNAKAIAAVSCAVQSKRDLPPDLFWKSVEGTSRSCEPIQESHR